ncbi:restriction endonuclease subunit S [Erysipelotrichaceae bacterium LKV-178-WT-2G]|uniref:Restriction endonuclease subunit S n=2 Tax=Floccifex porci TaxID=2606629 RepID=A0A7X2N4Q2_9FIRM|nr:restriction endonuclease subunit S [Floccifex porci]
MPKNSILFSSRAPIGYVAIADNDLCTNQGFKSVVPNDNINPLFVYYLLKFNKDKIEGLGSGTTFKEVSGTTMKNVIVKVPETIEEQRRISSILDAIDKKIELNQEINNNLEQQAQLLFKSWFVDFEPFNGSIPSDWEVVPLEKIVDFQNGYAFKSKELLNEPSSDCYQVFKQGHISRGGGFIPDGTKSWYPKRLASKLERFVLKKGDILMAMTDMKDNVAILGNTAIMPFDNEYIVNQRVGHIRANGYKGITYPFIYLLTNSTNFLTNLRSRANSGVQVNLSSTEIKVSQTVLPSEKVNMAFSEITLPMFEAIISNQLENQQLAQLRDTLLPKLMSGELDVSNIVL